MVQNFYCFNETIPNNIFKEFKQEINDNFRLREERNAQKKQRQDAENDEKERMLMNSVSSPTNVLSAEDFMLSLTKPKVIKEQFENDLFKSKEELVEFFSKGEDSSEYFNDNFDEETFEELPDYVARIVVRNVPSRKGKVIVRKKVFYIDGTIDTIFLSK
jgi:hypothetical protein